jgi:hypothetical protein
MKLLLTDAQFSVILWNLYTWFARLVLSCQKPSCAVVLLNLNPESISPRRQLHLSGLGVLLGVCGVLCWGEMLESFGVRGGALSWSNPLSLWGRKARNHTPARSLPGRKPSKKSPRKGGLMGFRVGPDQRKRTSSGGGMWFAKRPTWGNHARCNEIPLLLFCPFSPLLRGGGRRAFGL